MKKVFITGISGFAGSHLAEILIEEGGYEVYGTVYGDGFRVKGIPNDHFVPLNLMDREKTLTIIRGISPNWIFHLAAMSSPQASFADPSGTMTNNIQAQINVLDAAREVGGLERILVIGSAEEYGQVAENEIPIKETAQFNPLSPYAVSKIAQDYLGRQYWLSFRLPVIRVRPFNHIGERQAPMFVVPAFAQQIARIEAQKQEPIIKVGNLTAIRDFTDVKDMVRAYILAMQKAEPGDVYNLGRGQGENIQSILERLLAISPIKIEVQEDPQRKQPSDVPILICDSQKFIKLTGWQTEIPLEQTLRRVLDYWRQQTQI